MEYIYRLLDARMAARKYMACEMRSIKKRWLENGVTCSVVMKREVEKELRVYSKFLNRKGR